MRVKLLVMLVAIVAADVGRADPIEHKLPADAPSRFALPSDTGRYLGYHVGGRAGNPRKAEPRLPDEGTWGWDYQGIFPRRVILGWWHGRRSQGGTGAYKTDGPRLYEK